MRPSTDDEPVFTLRASDPLGPTLVEAWADLAVQLGVPVSQIQDARALAAQMRAWQNVRGKKIRD